MEAVGSVYGIESDFDGCLGTVTCGNVRASKSSRIASFQVLLILAKGSVV